MASSTTYLKRNANNSSTNKHNLFSTVVFNDSFCSDVKLTLKSRDGGGTQKEVGLQLHRWILADKSKFFQGMLIIILITSTICSPLSSSTILSVAMWSLPWSSDGGGTQKEVCLQTHRRILADKSKFFASRLNKSNYNGNITNSTISLALDIQQVEAFMAAMQY